MGFLHVSTAGGLPPEPAPTRARTPAPGCPAAVPPPGRLRGRAQRGLSAAPPHPGDARAGTGRPVDQPRGTRGDWRPPERDCSSRKESDGPAGRIPVGRVCFSVWGLERGCRSSGAAGYRGEGPGQGAGTARAPLSGVPTDPPLGQLPEPTGLLVHGGAEGRASCYEDMGPGGRSRWRVCWLSRKEASDTGAETWASVRRRGLPPGPGLRLVRRL